MLHAARSTSIGSSSSAQRPSAVHQRSARLVHRACAALHGLIVANSSLSRHLLNSAVEVMMLEMGKVGGRGQGVGEGSGGA